VLFDLQNTSWYSWEMQNHPCQTNRKATNPNWRSIYIVVKLTHHLSDYESQSHMILTPTYLQIHSGICLITSKKWARLLKTVQLKKESSTSPDKLIVIVAKKPLVVNNWRIVYFCKFVFKMEIIQRKKLKLSFNNYLVTKLTI